jgi:hypothetical protein
MSHSEHSLQAGECQQRAVPQVKKNVSGFGWKAVVTNASRQNLPQPVHDQAKKLRENLSKGKGKLPRNTIKHDLY